MPDSLQLTRKERLVPFTAGDKHPCNLIHVQSYQVPSKGPVLLVHGAGVRANIFRAPVKTNLVDFLIENGYDVWLENWRASIDLRPNHWTLDQAALFDHPEAVKTIVKETGWDTIKAVIHCQGSTSFMMSAIAGLVPQVKTVVSNAVSLHPIVPIGSLIKIKTALPFLHGLTDYLNPQWGLHAPNFPAKAITAFIELTHHVCDNPVCKQVSFTYGFGWPALWKHENLNPETHEWLKHEFAHVPLSSFDQISRCISTGHLVANESSKDLPQDFVAHPPQTDARFAFVGGAQNQCFLPQSQIKTFKYFDSYRKNYHSVHIFPTYSHLDVFIGKNAAQDTYPQILAELDKPSYIG